MAKRDSFLLRMDPKLLAAIRKWSEDEMRSTNGQIEFLLRNSLSKAGRMPQQMKDGADMTGDQPADEDRGPRDPDANCSES